MNTGRPNRRAQAWLLVLGCLLGGLSLAAAADEDALAANQQSLRQQEDQLRRKALELRSEALQLAMLSRRELNPKMRAGADESGGGGHSVDEHRPLNADGRVFVSDVSGSVVVSAWERNEVAIAGDLGSDVDRLDITGDASSLSAVVQPSKHAHSGSADLRLMVPAGARVSIETVSADIAVRGTRGEVKVNTVSGDVGLSVDAPVVSAQTVSGDLILQAPAADTTAHSVSGDLRMSGLQGRLNAETVSGHVDLAGARFSELRLKSISGDMHLDVSFAQHASVVGETLSGDISLQVPGDTSGTALLKSFSGEAQCNLASPGESSAMPGHKHEREYTFGDGKGVNLSLSTFSGDIHVERK